MEKKTKKKKKEPQVIEIHIYIHQDYPLIQPMPNSTHNPVTYPNNPPNYYTTSYKSKP